ncbi:hypothetical protein GLOTRDRAFT_141642 [Gloeophyllum trabeum ATCC 11539]|uniref:CoA-dependent acyltransferase n=1 Tax=Gloeophyllum trabeum (strain ATCC 11539 / FP-39264 / Madison 617) TaxID=670483 RepID=S7PQC5_GLOTA|nr:uncharacterized protein GLOTRDRAFT_141642 [Gloeophyllum trabeum ATCC 11539]EPQ50001.1 hypothetical protein GLOTRDRAFT_141642 [Gloeophyllum trabeum ATCC 11539]
MSQSAFPPMDFARFVWRRSTKDPSRYVREAHGGEVFEDIFNRFLHGEQTLSLGVELRITSPVKTTDLLDLARSAWIATRLEIPTIAASTEQDRKGDTFISYRALKDEDEARAWAEKTVVLYEETDDLMEARVEIGKIPLPIPSGEQTFIYIVPRSERSYGMLLYTHHTPFDGAASKIVLTKYLKVLANYLADSSLLSFSGYKWGEEVANLLPPTTEILGPNEDKSGEGYQRTLGTVMQEMATGMPCAYGFKVRAIGPGTTRRVWHTFSVAESTRMIDNARSLGFTINHIAQAALCLICVDDNPPTDSTPADAAFVFNGLVDGRNRLLGKYSSRDGYPGYALAMSPVIVRVSVVTSSASLGTKGQLLRVAEVVKQEYKKQRDFPALLAIASQESELMFAGLKAGTAPPPPPSTGPFYAADGQGELYLDAVYNDKRGQPVIEVVDFFQSLNKHDPGPFFRGYSWAGKFTLSLDYNEFAMPTEVVQGFLNKWVELLSLL